MSVQFTVYRTHTLLTDNSLPICTCCKSRNQHKLHIDTTRPCIKKESSNNLHWRLSRVRPNWVLYTRSQAHIHWFVLLLRRYLYSLYLEYITDFQSLLIINTHDLQVALVVLENLDGCTSRKLWLHRLCLVLEGSSTSQAWVMAIYVSLIYFPILKSINASASILYCLISKRYRTWCSISKTYRSTTSVTVADLCCQIFWMSVWGAVVLWHVNN